MMLMSFNALALGVSPFEFFDKSSITKTRDLGLFAGDPSLRLFDTATTCVGPTDGQTDIPTMARALRSKLCRRPVKKLIFHKIVYSDIFEMRSYGILNDTLISCNV